MQQYCHDKNSPAIHRSKRRLKLSFACSTHFSSPPRDGRSPSSDSRGASESRQTSEGNNQHTCVFFIGNTANMPRDIHWITFGSLSYSSCQHLQQIFLLDADHWLSVANHADIHTVEWIRYHCVSSTFPSPGKKEKGSSTQDYQVCCMPIRVIFSLEF